jgi:hypothetical protein
MYTIYTNSNSPKVRGKKSKKNNERKSDNPTKISEINKTD